MSNTSKDNKKSENFYYRFHDDKQNKLEPIGTLGLVETEGAKDFIRLVNQHLVENRKAYTEKIEIDSPGFLRDNYIVDARCKRFSTGEGKARFYDTVRGHDLFILVDVMNYSVSYKFYLEDKPMTPDEHFADLKRLILAASGKARRINVIMPFLYESRQHRRSSRESLDCAYMLEELETLGVENIITFDAHDPRVANATPLSGFENIPIQYQLVKALSKTIPDLDLRGDNVVFVAPDEGAIDRAMFFSTLLEAPVGTFYKLRDYTKIVDGKNPIIAHEYLGDDVEGKDIIIVDDMISSGDSMLDIAIEMKKRKAGRVICCATFALFTSGLENFDKAYEEGYIDYVFSTNLIYRTPELLGREWYYDIDCSNYVALLIDALNHDASISQLIDHHDIINDYLDELEEKEDQ